MLSNSVPKLFPHLIVVLAVFTGMVVSVPDAVAKTRFHISYLWHHDLESVQDYRRKVGNVLGHVVARNLKR